jgi:LAO/AO transport system kinase
VNETKDTGFFYERRKKQVQEWLEAMIKDRVLTSFFTNSMITQHLPQVEKQVLVGEKTTGQAVEELLQLFNQVNRS